ncbi:FtsW/RodA/SpoVE family cell cycle protein [Pseudobutyrivibrio xylanivorans]|uniref:FtsW/RodA/SpoVE family cell cycle protein n=2 Tax=Pseudobutyrivibrio xylanivorans TaxID=185007 RepID=A0A5P6VTH1_PSEXY|nr:FtsW/RodA/SpoVE family cell cycle protein [Pseudobutyrivibrio xylanivorans]
MVSVITSFSRITILAYIIIFTICDCILVFEHRIGEAFGSILTTIQSVMIVLFLVNSSVVLFYSKDDASILVLLTLQLLFFAVCSIVLNALTVPASKALLNNIFLMLSFSYVMLERLKMARAIRQFVFTIIALAVGCLVIYILRRITSINKYMLIFAIVGILSLLAVSLVGTTEYGAKLSLSFGAVSIQPSEFVKLSYLFFISGCIVTWKDFRGFLIAGIGAALHILVLVYSKDLGTALIFLVTYVFLIFIAYKNYVVLIMELGIATIGGILAYSMFPHIRTRFLAWSDPLSVIDNQGYQISQSLFAIGTGSWLGSGLNNGLPNKIPVVVKDFIFAAISEEMGAVVAICLILIYMCTVIMIFNISFNSTYSFYMLVNSGFAIIFAIQTILNIGGVIKFIPSTGVTLPFISYGGSSLLSMFIGSLIAECSEELWQLPVIRRRK